MSKIFVLRLIGLVLIVAATTPLSASLPDFLRGLMAGVGIGLMIFSVRLQMKKSKTA